jgi:hypothetical protein
MQSRGTSSGYARRRRRLPIQVGNWETGCSSMQMRHVEWVRGGGRGLGLGLGLRFGAQGSRRRRRGLGAGLVTFEGVG